MLGVREVKHETDVSKSSKNYWIAGIPTAQKHDLGLCLSLYWSCFSLISKNFKNHLSKNLRFFRADLAFFNTYFYGVRITLLSSTFFCPTLNFFQRPRKYFYGHYVPALGRFLLLDFEALLGPLGRARGLLRTLELLLMKAELRSLWGDVEAVGL